MKKETSKIKAIKINAEKRSIEIIELRKNINEINSSISKHCIKEECLLIRDTDSLYSDANAKYNLKNNRGGFRIRDIPPVIGNAIIIGGCVTEEGEYIRSYSSYSIFTLPELEKKIDWLDRNETSVYIKSSIEEIQKHLLSYIEMLNDQMGKINIDDIQDIMIEYVNILHHNRISFNEELVFKTFSELMNFQIQKLNEWAKKDNWSLMLNILERIESIGNTIQTIKVDKKQRMSELKFKFLDGNFFS